MKTPLLIKFLGVLALLAFVVGCETNAQFKESNLTDAGFKAVPAKTAAQQAHLKTLSTTKVTQVKRNGVQYYVYPDVAHNVLYVGKQPQYDAYRNNKAALASDRAFQTSAQSSFISNDAFYSSFDTWGPFEQLPWN